MEMADKPLIEENNNFNNIQGYNQNNSTPYSNNNNNPNPAPYPNINSQNNQFSTPYSGNPQYQNIPQQQPIYANYPNQPNPYPGMQPPQPIPGYQASPIPQQNQVGALNVNNVPNIDYQKYTNVSQVHHKGVHQPDANNIYISTGCCFKIMPIIFFIFGAVFSCMFLFAEGIGGIIGTVFGVIFVLISFCMMCKGYYSVYFTMGPNNLTVTKKALCGRSTRVYLPGELISVELTHDILPTRDGRTFNYQLNINTTNSGTDIAFRVGQSSPIFTMEEIGYFNYVINFHIQNNMRM